ncbi:MAG: FecR domain-containing protein [Vulcanimicrobiota bacterium]
MKKKLIIISICLFLVLTINTLQAKVSDWKLVVKVKGTVESKFELADRWKLIWQSRKLTNGDLARTGKDSRAKIRLADQSVVTLGQNTQVEMSQFEVKEKNTLTKIKLFYGKVRSTVGKMAGKKTEFEVETPNALLAARGTEFYVDYVDQPETNEKSEEGSDMKDTSSLGLVTSLQTGINNQVPGGGLTRVIVFSSVVDVTAQGVTTPLYAGNTAIIGANGIIHVNPPSFQPPAPGGSPVEGSDGDLASNAGSDGSGSPAEVVTNAVPVDPSAPTGNTPVVPAAPSNPGVIVPPAGNVGSITIIIEPPGNQ